MVVITKEITGCCLCDQLISPWTKWAPFDRRCFHWAPRFFSYWGHFDLVKQVKFAVSRYFLQSAWEEWAEICHADVSWPPSELIQYWSRWGATAIRSPYLVVHLYLVISEDMKIVQFLSWGYPWLLCSHTFLKIFLTFIYTNVAAQ